MSESILKILASELTMLRITCLKCGASVEIPINRVSQDQSTEITCPLCQAAIRSSHGNDALSKLASGIKGLNDAKGVEVSFIVRQPNSDQK